MKLKDHHQKHEETRRQLRCEICGETFANTYQSRAHDEKFHPEKFDFKCKFCNAMYRTATALAGHVTVKHADASTQQRTFAPANSTKLFGIPGISYSYN